MLYDLLFTQFYKSGMSRYKYLKVFEYPLDFKITRVDWIYNDFIL